MTHPILTVKSKIRKKHQVSRLARRSGTQISVLMTDSERLGDVALAVAAVPAGTFIILREYHLEDRAQLTHQLKRICRQKGLHLLISGDPHLARKTGSKLHLRDYDLRPMNYGRGMRPHTAAVHSSMGLRRAFCKGAKFILVSPVFKTQSHKGVRTLGTHRLSRLVSHSKLPVIALGGINERTAVKLKGINLAGVAAIDGWVLEKTNE